MSINLESLGGYCLRDCLGLGALVVCSQIKNETVLAGANLSGLAFERGGCVEFCGGTCLAFLCSTFHLPLSLTSSSYLFIYLS